MVSSLLDLSFNVQLALAPSVNVKMSFCYVRSSSFAI
jgi:hypothetical protein